MAPEAGGPGIAASLAPSQYPFGGLLGSLGLPPTASSQTRRREFLWDKTNEMLDERRSLLHVNVSAASRRSGPLSK